MHYFSPWPGITFSNSGNIFICLTSTHLPSMASAYYAPISEAEIHGADHVVDIE